MLTLRKLLETVADYDRHVELAVETKHPTRYGGLVERRLVEMLGDFGWDRAGSPARVMSFSLNAVNRVRRLAPELDVVMLVDKAHHWPVLRPVVGDDWIIGPGIKELREHPGLGRHLVKEGREIHVWTVNTAEDLDLCLDLGVTAVISDRPGLHAGAARGADPSLAALGGPRGGQLGFGHGQEVPQPHPVRTRRRRGRPPPALSVRLGQALQGLPRCGRRRRTRPSSPVPSRACRASAT